MPGGGRFYGFCLCRHVYLRARNERCGQVDIAAHDGGFAASPCRDGALWRKGHRFAFAATACPHGGNSAYRQAGVLHTAQGPRACASWAQPLHGFLRRYVASRQRHSRQGHENSRGGRICRPAGQHTERRRKAESNDSQGAGPANTRDIARRAYGVPRLSERKPRCSA